MTATTTPGPEVVQERLSARAAIVMAIVVGVCAGYLDLLIVVGKKYFWNEPRYFWSARDSAWSVPVAHAVLILVPGLVVAIANS